jgi:type I restriction enzyme S subunit
MFPEYNTQIQIGNFLRSIDKKIELNNKINSELESMAKLIYDYWFVQFDFPDENGKPYKSSGGKMVWNEELKREIPEGWEVADLSIFDLYQPKTITEKDLNSNDKYFVYGANGIVGKYKSFNHIDSEIVVTCRGNSCGNILRTTPKAWITGNAMVVKSKQDFVHTEFIFQTLQRIGIQRAISGSGQPQITRTNLSPLKFVLPDMI